MRRSQIYELFVIYCWCGYLHYATEDLNIDLVYAEMTFWNQQCHNRGRKIFFQTKRLQSKALLQIFCGVNKFTWHFVHLSSDRNQILDKQILLRALKYWPKMTAVKYDQRGVTCILLHTCDIPRILETFHSLWCLQCLVMWNIII